LGINSGRERTGDVASGRGGRRGDPGLGELESESEDHTEGDDLCPIRHFLTDALRFPHMRFVMAVYEFPMINFRFSFNVPMFQSSDIAAEN
jgi:hypothetical protein